MKHFLILFTVSFFCYKSLHALDVPGYIINNAKDTVRGQIVYTPPKAKGKNGPYETDTSMTWKVRFTDANGKKENYRPREIRGFGFQLEDTWHHYETITPVKGMGGLVRYEFFGRRVIDGPVQGFRGIEGLEYFETDENKTYDWWFETRGTGLNGFIYDLFSTKKKKLAQELKYFFQMEDAFLETLPEKVEKENVYKIIQSYNSWKKSHP